MQQQFSLLRPWQTLPAILLLGLSFSGCFLKQDRTTSIYGTITNLNQQPVDSVMLSIQGAEGLKYDKLKEVYSDANGHDEAVVDASKSYSALIVVIPFSRNPHYTDHYEGLIVKKDDMEIPDCCYASIGKKTKYDFKLLPKI
jgi:hypothetical protein